MCVCGEMKAIYRDIFLLPKTLGATPQINSHAISRRRAGAGTRAGS